MLSVYTGEEKFLKGVSLYLKAHLYGNTVADDLWSGIQQATSKLKYLFMSILWDVKILT